MDNLAYDPYAKNPDFTIDRLLLDLQTAINNFIIKPNDTIHDTLTICKDLLGNETQYPVHELLGYKAPDLQKLADFPADITKFFAIMQYASRNQKWPSLTIVTQHGNKIKFTFNVEKKRINISNGCAMSNPDNIYYGSIYPTAINFKPETKYAPRERIKQIISAYVANPEKLAKIQGQHTGRCCFCARELTNPHSIAYGYGAICADNYQLPYSIAKIEDAETQINLEFSNAKS